MRSAPRWPLVFGVALVCTGFVVGIAPFVARDLLSAGPAAGAFIAGGAAAITDLASSTHASVTERLAVMFVTGGWAPLGEPLVSSHGGAATLSVRAGEVALAIIGGARVVGLARLDSSAALAVEHAGVAPAWE